MCLGGSGIGLGASAVVTGTGSLWQIVRDDVVAGLEVGGSLTATDGGMVQSAYWITMDAGSTMSADATGVIEAGQLGITMAAGSTVSVDTTSVIEAGNSGGAEAGFLTIDFNSSLDGAGTIVGSVIDNGTIDTTSGTLKITRPAGGADGVSSLAVGGLGSVTVSDGGVVRSADGISMASGATLSVDATSAIEAGSIGGAAAGCVTIDANSSLSGAGTIVGSVVDNGTVDASNGTLKISGALSGDGNLNIGNKSTLELGGAASGATITFDPTGTYGTLQVDGTTLPTDTIREFAPGDMIYLAGTPSSGGASAQLLANNVLRIVTGGSTPETYSLQLDPTQDFSQNSFQLSFGSGSGIDISLNPNLSINATYDPSVTALDTPSSATYNPTLYTEYTDAIQAAEQFYENKLTNPITVNISFGWGEFGGNNHISSPKRGENSTLYDYFNYDQLLSKVKKADTTSQVQVMAVSSLPAADPTGGALFGVSYAEANALGLSPGMQASDGAVGLNATAPWGWIQSNVTPTQDDAVGTLEHEISEVLGRAAAGGTIAPHTNNPYTLLDMFRYTAIDGGATDAPGTAVGVRDEPFVAGYSASANSYFSYDGKTVTLPYETPLDVAGDADVGDWAPSVRNNSYADDKPDGANMVSMTDLEEMNVLGYHLATAIRVDPGPTAGDGAVTEGHGQTVSLTALILGLITPGFSGDTETLTAVSAAYGSATLGADNTVTYTAPATGPDTISYSVADEYGDTATGEVAVTVDPGPTASDGAVTEGHGQTVSLTALMLGLITPGSPVAPKLDRGPWQRRARLKQRRHLHRSGDRP